MLRWLQAIIERREHARYERWRLEYIQTDIGMKMEAQVQASRDGLEIEPPWVVWRIEGPFCFGQGTQEFWWGMIWQPFWKELSSEQRIEYVIRWKADWFWRETLLTPTELASLPVLDNDAG